MASEEALMGELQELQRKLGMKQFFEEAVSSILSLLRDRYTAYSPSLRKTMYSAVCRVATVLQTRYTTPGFWLAGLKLFEEAESLFTESSEKKHMKHCIAKAREHLHEMENVAPVVSGERTDSRFLFEGHLTVGPEPPPPAWLVAQNLLTAIAVGQEWSRSESSLSQDESAVSETVREFMSNIENTLNLDAVIEAALQENEARPPRPPPASKEVVANLPVITVTEEILYRMGSETGCTVCQEKLAINDTMQELPCKHFFHPLCLKPWLDVHNSCPICRHELKTDDHTYESWKEREKEAEEERKGAANAVREGEFMYV